MPTAALELVMAGNQDDFYVHPRTGEQLPRVSKILNLLDKPWKVNWKRKIDRQRIIDNLNIFTQIVDVEGEEAAHKFVRDLPDDESAMLLGQQVHDAVEAFLMGIPVEVENA